MNCWHCGSKLIWGGDHTYEDYCISGEGIVTNLSCSNGACDVEQVLVYAGDQNADSSEGEAISPKKA